MLRIETLGSWFKEEEFVGIREVLYKSFELVEVFFFKSFI